jgi:hypothetical protein
MCPVAGGKVTIHLGDQVVLHRWIDFRAEETIKELVRSGQLPSDDAPIVLAGLPSEVSTFDIATTLGYVHVRSGIFVGWDDIRVTGVPLFDYQGRDEGGPGWWPTHASDTAWCDDCDGGHASG